MEEPILTLTPSAREHVLATMAREGLTGRSLRISVVPGGCSGYEYAMDFVERPVEGDRVVECGEIRIFVENGSAERLAGTVIDYVGGLHGGGLKFQNPRAVHSCGCGTSFTTG